MEEYQDIDLVCICGKSFVWTRGEQKFVNDLREKGKLDRRDPASGEIIPGEVKTPKRCKECREEKRREREESRSW